MTPVCSTVAICLYVAHLYSSIASVNLVPQEQYSNSEDVTLEHLEVNSPSVDDYPNIKKSCLDIYPTHRDVAWVPNCLISAPVLELPNFCNLIQLQVNFHSFQRSFLIDLPHNCLKLQALKVYISDFIDDWSESYLNSDKRNGWTHSLCSLNCIVLHLNTVEHRGYVNTPELHELTANNLHKGLVLK
ncbi:hypothetical protein AHAS_Ahas09G0083000 [Arachis hypogaea]